MTKIKTGLEERLRRWAAELRTLREDVDEAIDITNKLCELVPRPRTREEDNRREAFAPLDSPCAEAPPMPDESHEEEPPLEANIQRRRQPCPRCENRYTVEGGRPCPICRPALHGFDEFMQQPSPREEGMDPPEEEESSPIPGMSRDEYDERMARAEHSRKMHRFMYGRGKKEDADDA